MKFVSKDRGVAQAEGAEAFRVRARRRLARAFLTEQLTTDDQALVPRLLQTMDYSRPLVVGPGPGAPDRLFPLTGGFASGYFTDAAPEGTPLSAWWSIGQGVSYLRWYLPPVSAREPGAARYLVPSLVRRAR